MDMEPKVKKHLQYDYVDGISELPDSVLCKILSTLPIKDVVGTCILSKRWKDLFPFSYPLTRLDLDDSSPLNNKANADFVGFMDKLFTSTLVDVPSVEILKLHIKKDFGDEKTISWVCSALRLKVRELLLHFNLDQPEPLFGCLNGCTTLTRLELGEQFRVLVPDGFSLPNLKVLLLSLMDFGFKDGNMFNKLISGCPKLEDLSLVVCFFDPWEGIVCIRSLVLKNFSFGLAYHNIKLELDAPNLEVLNYEYGFPGMASLCNFKSLRAASFSPSLFFQDDMPHSDEEDVPVLAALVSACSSTAHLYLSGYSMTTLQSSTMHLPEFRNLTSLELGCVVTTEGWMMLARLLILTPNLEKLVFEKGIGWFGRGYSEFESLLPNPPICLELHLRVIKFEVFTEEDDELNLVEYFLENGKVIQTLEIYCSRFMEISTSRLLMLPNHSKIDFQRRQGFHRC